MPSGHYKDLGREGRVLMIESLGGSIFWGFCAKGFDSVCEEG